MKRHLLTWSVLLVLVLLVAMPVAAQVANIAVEGIPDRYKITNLSQATTGLTNVGIGQRVVMYGWISSGLGNKTSDTLVAVSAATWNITVKPPSSTAAISNFGVGLQDTVWFIPDSVGAYTITASLNSISTAATITINAAKFVGTGISVAQTSNVPNTCGCHSSGTMAQNFVDWKTTNHAQAVKRKMNEVGGHFSASCMSCHSIGYDGLTTTGNMGWDDLAVADSANFTQAFPKINGSLLQATFKANGPGSWDTLVLKSPSMAARAGIQCENCHGPAGEHAKTGNKALLNTTLSADVCAPCHFSSDRHGIGYAWTATAHSTSNTEGVSFQGTDRFTCARCHTGEGYISVVLGGQTLPNNASSVVSYPNSHSITCQTCHDPHKNNNPSQVNATTGAYSFPQLRVNNVADACTGCHITRLSSRGGLHTSHQGSMLIGHSTTPFTLALAEAYRAPGGSLVMANNVGLWSGWELPGYKYSNSSHSDIAERCVTCHMAKSPSYINAEKANFIGTVGQDTMIQKVGRHTFRVAYDVDSTNTYLNPTGCVECHGQGTSIEFVDMSQAKVQSLLTTLFALLPKRDSLSLSVVSPIDTITYQGSATAAQKLTRRALKTIERAAGYNYIFVNNDGSFGVHNHDYATQLLTSSIEQLQLAAGAAAIDKIADVPGDNGRNVMVRWNEFPAEMYSFGRVTSYGVFRKDPLLPATSFSIPTAENFKEVIKNTTVGSQMVLGGYVWTYVGGVPAGQGLNNSGNPFATYSIIAPTILDSTKIAGMKYTAFFVAGYTADPTVTYASPIDSGYSLNNLFPTQVAGLSSASNAQGVTLTWSKSTNDQDNDVTQFAVYRGTTAGFAIGAPLATVNAATTYLDGSATQGQTYYYKVAAIDNAGNQGPVSAEVSLKVTSVEQFSGIPTEFTLGQNYPNPFNPSTQIRFGLPNQAFVKLMIYSVSGELVRTLVNTEMSAGFYGVTWNGMNNDGLTVSTGVYIYRVQAGSFVSSKKMLLLK